MEEMILEAKKLKNKDLTPDIGLYNRWESSWVCSDNYTNTFSAETPEEAVRMAYNALMGVK